MSKATTLHEIVDGFVRAALSREITTNKAWDYGWSQASYRRSSDAAMTHNRRQNVRLRADGIDSFEEASNALLAVQQVRQRYDADEVWELTASLVGMLPLPSSADQLSPIIRRRIENMISPPTSLVVFAVANVARLEKALDIGPLLIGSFDRRFKELVQIKVGRAVLEHAKSDVWWMSDSERTDTDKSAPIMLAYIGQSQLERAISDAGETFEDLVSIALMGQPDLDELSLFSLRGDTHRPGLRGLVVDRQALTELSERVPEISRETACQVLVDGVLGERATLHWYGEHSFPLERLLTDSEKRSTAERILLGSTSIHRRLRVAARWHAKAHWSVEPADAVLALGIAFDSMLSEENPSPGRVLSERYALLDPNPEGRRRRYQRFQSEYYPARSSVAHGAKRESFNAEFVREMAKQGRLTFQRILTVTKALGVSSEDEYRTMWEALRWKGPGALPI